MTDQLTASLKVEKFSRGFYRMSGENYYASIKRNSEDKKWHVVIRRQTDGTLVRFAGIWNTKRDAVEEAEHVLGRM